MEHLVARKNRPFSLSAWLRREREETAVLLRCIPATAVTLFVVSVICMNLLANKTLVQTEWLALDGGILVSWLSFLCMDVITKHFGPRASNRVAVLAAGAALPEDLLRLLLPVRAWDQLLQAADLGVVDGLVLLKHMVRVVVGLFAQVLEKGG